MTLTLAILTCLPAGHDYNYATGTSLETLEHKFPNCPIVPTLCVLLHLELIEVVTGYDSVRIISPPICYHLTPAGWAILQNLTAKAKS